MRGSVYQGLSQKSQLLCPRTQARNNPEKLSSLAPSFGWAHVGEVGYRRLFL